MHDGLSLHAIRYTQKLDPSFVKQKHSFHGGFPHSIHPMQYNKLKARFGFTGLVADFLYYTLTERYFQEKMRDSFSFPPLNE